MNFDAATLRYLDAELETPIETYRPDGTPRRTIIWVLVDGDDVFVRSWKGDRGYWFQSATEPDAKIALIIDGRTVPVVAHAATDPESVERCSEALRRKYPGNDSLAGMLRSDILGTTLRLEPAAAG
jgi:hypothetical protein